MRYQLVEQLSKKAVPYQTIAVDRLCRVLAVSRSGYYGARHRAQTSQAGPKVCATSMQLKSEFAASGKVYGSRRLCAALRARGVRIGRHRVRSLMRRLHAAKAS